jgi:hypothetical protein
MFTQYYFCVSFQEAYKYTFSRREDWQVRTFTIFGRLLEIRRVLAKKKDVNKNERQMSSLRVTITPAVDSEP